jgi:hypothetical protein
MSKVIDFFSRKPLDVISKRIRADDNWVDEHGKYIGVLTKRDCKRLREILNEMALLYEQKEKILHLWNQANERYYSKLSYCLTYLEEHTPEEKKVNLGKDEIYIDENGHVWVVYGNRL